ncbi:hypothetical protein CGT68_17785 [Vibrio cholerae]|uniref:hypothetical protein n=1 Tax=Vibrio cholerae TaxID=666 RepID=UPI000BA91792|nr:hypothetical protein [Vibrio cholerae]PAS39874.1 hypothetical protein CGT68_17785 [Vibrio cholerae]PAS40349.1 hypothetical protein CGT69_14815 [Vibrio cholerae]
MPPLLLKDLHQVVDILPNLTTTNLNDCDYVTFEKILNLLAEYDVEHVIVDAIPRFLLLAEPLFTLKRLDDGETLGLQNKLKNLQIQLEQTEEEKERFKIKSEIGTIKKQLSNTGGKGNALVTQTINEYQQVTGYSEARVNIEMWIESVRKYHKMNAQDLDTLTYAKFVSLSNTMTLNLNIERAQRLKAESDAQKSKPTPPMR